MARTTAQCIGAQNRSRPVRLHVGVSAETAHERLSQAPQWTKGGGIEMRQLLLLVTLHWYPKMENGCYMSHG